jgi:hypothetical protein
MSVVIIYTKTRIPSKKLASIDYHILSKQNLIQENLNERYSFFNEYCNKIIPIDSDPNLQEHILNFFSRLV